jgi:glutamate N-acetyltransferase/amino-acid N-acetyltransferase
MKFKEIPSSITAPQGFLTAGVFCDIKRLGTGKGSNKGPKRDLAIILSEVPAAVAGMFTTSQVCAAPVKVSAPRAAGASAQAVVVNSGNANACTGAQGLRDAQEMARVAAKLLKLPEESVLVASTGRIGVNMPMANVKKGIHAAAGLLDAKNAAHAAEAIMTSDTRPKEIAVEFKLGGKTVRMGGICKGAGMIQPGMSATGERPAAAPYAALHATMLSIITTDAAIDHLVLKSCLAEAVANSFNRITVDGDMSTNDTVIVLANGMAGNEPVTAADKKGLAIFQAALNHVTLQLARKIVLDGEGVTRFVTVRVSGAETFSDADTAARAVANSSLVKTSWFGGDPNWGRILGALGYSAAKVEEGKVDVAYGTPGSRKLLFSLKKGQPTNTSFAALCKITAQKEFDLHINLNLGRASAVIYAADLTEEYVDFNKGDIGDPASLGG